MIHRDENDVCMRDVKHTIPRLSVKSSYYGLKRCIYLDLVYDFLRVISYSPTSFCVWQLTPRLLQFVELENYFEFGSTGPSNEAVAANSVWKFG